MEQQAKDKYGVIAENSPKMTDEEIQEHNRRQIEECNRIAREVESEGMQGFIGSLSSEERESGVVKMSISGLAATAEDLLKQPVIPGLPHPLVAFTSGK